MDADWAELHQRWDGDAEGVMGIALGPVICTTEHVAKASVGISAERCVVASLDGEPCRAGLTNQTTKERCGWNADTAEAGPG